MSSRDNPEHDAERILRDFENTFSRTETEELARTAASQITEVNRKLDYMQYAINALRAPLWVCAVCLVILIGRSWLG